MKLVRITNARTHFTELVPHVAVGEETIATQRDKPVVKLVRVNVHGRRPLGADEGTFVGPDSFAEPVRQLAARLQREA